MPNTENPVDTTSTLNSNPTPQQTPILNRDSSSRNLEFSFERMSLNDQLNQKIDSVFNNFRIPDAVKQLPEFDGNPRLLYDFIENVEEILLIADGVSRTNYAKVLLRAIRNKIVKDANEVLNMYGTQLVWDDIKNNLILHYSDKRNETSLIRDLHNLKQGNNTVEKFYSKVIEIFSCITNHIKVHETENSVVLSKQKLYEEMCLNTFLSGLKEPLGSTIRAMKPTKLVEALSYCLKEQNIHYLQSSSTYSTPRQDKKPTPTFPGNLRPFNQTQYSPNPSNFSQQRISNISPFNQQRSAYPNFSKNQSNIQKFNVSPVRAQGSPSNVFRQTSFLNSFPLPEPMDTTSGHTRNRPNFSNNTKPKNQEFFNTEEIMCFDQTNPENSEFQDLDQFSSQNTGEPESMIDDENFRIPASENPSVT